MASGRLEAQAGGLRPLALRLSPGWLAAGLLILGLVVLPFLDVPVYYLRFLGSVFLYVTLAQSWNIIGGYTGYVSFGHVTFFGLASFFPGVVGAIYAHQASFVSPPDMFPLVISFKSLIYAVVGGASTVLGPILGATFLEVLNTFLTTSALGRLQLDRIVFGLILVVVVLATPGGLLGLARRARRRGS